LLLSLPWIVYIPSHLRHEPLPRNKEGKMLNSSPAVKSSVCFRIYNLCYHSVHCTHLLWRNSYSSSKSMLRCPSRLTTACLPGFVRLGPMCLTAVMRRQTLFHPAPVSCCCPFSSTHYRHVVIQWQCLEKFTRIRICLYKGDSLSSFTKKNCFIRQLFSIPASEESQMRPP
jgi:hypothetical protein